MYIVNKELSVVDSSSLSYIYIYLKTGFVAL